MRNFNPIVYLAYMDKKTIEKYRLQFEEAGYIEDGLEYWLARELQELLSYSEWRNFIKVVDKAIESCKNAGNDPYDHFVDVNKSIPTPKGGSREIGDIMLTRYACYLIAQNGDPRKEPVAFAQSYFALQTRKQELLEERIELARRMEARQRLRESETKLSALIYERDVDNKGFGRIRSKGDSALFGGNSTQAMKTKLNVPKGRPLADFLPTITINAKALAADITNANIQQKDLKGEEEITGEHIDSNLAVRKLLKDQANIRPEDLPAAEDLKKLERRVKTSEKKLAKGSKSLKGKSEEEE